MVHMNSLKSGEALVIMYLYNSTVQYSAFLCLGRNSPVPLSHTLISSVNLLSVKQNCTKHLQKSTVNTGVYSKHVLCNSVMRV